MMSFVLIFIATLLFAFAAIKAYRAISGCNGSDASLVSLSPGKAGFNAANNKDLFVRAHAMTASRNLLRKVRSENPGVGETGFPYRNQRFENQCPEINKPESKMPEHSG